MGTGTETEIESAAGVSREGGTARLMAEKETIASEGGVEAQTTVAVNMNGAETRTATAILGRGGNTIEAVVGVGAETERRGPDMTIGDGVGAGAEIGTGIGIQRGNSDDMGEGD